MFARIHDSMVEVMMSRGEKLLARRDHIVWEDRGIAVMTSSLAGYALYLAEEDGVTLACTAELSRGIDALNLDDGEMLLCRQEGVIAASARCDKPAFVIDCHDELTMQRWIGPGTVYFQYEGMMQEVDLCWGQEIHIRPGSLLTCDVLAEIHMQFDRQHSHSRTDLTPVVHVIGPGVVRVKYEDPADARHRERRGLCCSPAHGVNKVTASHTIGSATMRCQPRFSSARRPYT